MTLVFGLALLAASASTSVDVQGSDSALNQMRTELARVDMAAASKIFDDTVAARRPGKQTNKPDPLLDRMIVELLAKRGNVQALASIVDRLVAHPMVGDGARYRILQAETAGNTGKFAQAEALFSALAADTGLASAERQTAQLGLIRQKFLSDPQTAVAISDKMDRSSIAKDQLWQFDLLGGRASAVVAGDGAAAIKLKQAWSEAIDAEPSIAATARVAGDLAFLAARAGDRMGYLNMLAVDHFNRRSDFGRGTLVSNLPVCGESGITPEDVAIVEAVYRTQENVPELDLVWASRPGIGRIFMASVMNRDLPRSADGQISHFALRCRTAPSADFAVRSVLEDGVSAWMTGLGAYPFTRGNERNDLFALIAELTKREALYGKTSIMLLPVLLQIQTAMRPAAFSPDQDSGKRAMEMAQRVNDVLVANKAPASLVLSWKLAMLGMSVMTQSSTNEQSYGEAKNLLLAAAKDPAVPIDLIYALTAGAADAPTVPNAYKIAVLDASLALIRQHSSDRDPRAAALALRLAKLKTENGDKVAAAAARGPLKLASDLCMTLDPAPRYTSSDIKSEDYPSDLIFSSIIGSATIEFGLDGSGQTTEPRVIVANPPFAFDQITLDRAATIRFDMGSSKSCHGQIQNVVWQLPY